MTILSRMLKLRKVTVSMSSGSDPDVIEIEDCSNVYELFPKIDTPCDASPAGQCEYSILDPDICIHCKRATGA